MRAHVKQKKNKNKKPRNIKNKNCERREDNLIIKLNSTPMKKCDHGQAYVVRNPSISSRMLGSFWNQKMLRKGEMSSVWVGWKIRRKKMQEKIR